MGRNAIVLRAVTPFYRAKIIENTVLYKYFTEFSQKWPSRSCDSH